jgi:hypothetical protein
VAQGFGTTLGTNTITAYSFDWGDGTAVTSAVKSIGGVNQPIPIAFHRYGAAGVYTLRMTVSDSGGNTPSTTQTITVLSLPAPTVTINPGDNVVNQLNSAPANCLIRINAGTYTATTSWTPKSGQQVIANGVVTITGGGSIAFLALFTTATGVIVQGIRATAFTSYAFQFGASSGTGASAVFKDCEVDTCGTNGVASSGGLNGFNGGTIVIDTCHFHNTTDYNVAAGNGSTVTIIAGEYDHGFTDTSGSVNPNAGDGVWKHVHSTGDYIVGANIHDNQGSGLWWDGNNTNIYVCLCSVTNNYGPGVFSEINDAAFGGGGNNIPGNLDGSGFSIRWLFNTLSGNGYPATTFFPTGNIYPSNLWVSKSDKIEMAYNWIDGGAHAIVMDYQVGRPLGHNLANISVHDNDIRFRETSAGGGSGVGRIGFHNSVAGTAYALTNVTFTRNHYFAAHDNLGAGWTHFMVYVGTSEIPTDFATWKGTYGYDTSGSTMALDTAWPH